MRKRTKVELLAPAGNETGFYGAVSAGADAVYLGGNRFGARAYAENFTTESLTECIRYARLFGRKVYLTVNTLLKERELSELDEYLTPFYEAGLDAVIIQDLGVLRHIRERFPRLALHVSTQMTLCSGYGAALLKELGASRIVPARELSLRELTEIKASSHLELETFVHGAMCYCYSGQCLFSSILGGRSGNRGRCAQPCRLPYGVKVDFPSGESKSLLREGYPLSLKDMCTVWHIPQLIEAGIDSFKIEGRMKKPEYTAGVTAVYRKFIDKYYDLRERLSPEEAAEAYRRELKDSQHKDALKQLTSLYIRSEVQDGYYFRRNGREMVTLKSPAYSECDEKMLNGISERYLKNRLKLPVSISAEFQTGEPARVALRLHGFVAEAVGDIVEAAKSRPVTEENIKKQLGKLGDSNFCAADMQIFVAEDAFYPLKQINELRRAAAEILEQKIVEASLASKAASRPQTGDPIAVSARREAEVGSADPMADAEGWVISVRTQEQLSAVVDWFEGRKAPVNRIYVDGDLAVQDRTAVVSCCERLGGQVERWIALPYILRNGDREYMERLVAFVRENRFRGFLVRSLDEAGYLRMQEDMLPMRTDAGVYIWNREALQEISGMGAAGGCLPYELNGAEQRELLRSSSAGAFPFENNSSEKNSPEKFSLEKIVYGRIPMMITANCVLRTADKCEAASQLHDKDGPVKLVDRYKKEFPVLRNCLHCMNVVYNSVPYSLRYELSKWSGTEKRIDFTLEEAVGTRAVLDAFLRGADLPFEEYTTGHEKRGVQ